MKTIFLFIILIGIGGYAFGEQHSDEIIAFLGSSFNLKFGQTAQINSEELRITFLNFTDSRCPANVMCVWAGEATVDLLIQKSSQTQEIQISTEEPELKVFDYTIHLVNLDPLPLYGHPTNSSEYTATLGVTQGDQILQKNKVILIPPIPQEKHCKPSLVLILKYNGMEACVKPTSVDKLIERGWGELPK